MRQLAAEFLGTFVLVFMGTGAIVINEVSHGTVTHVGISLTFGLVVLALIYALGEVSGAHLNPAVTVGFWASRRFPACSVIPYIVSQCLGAMLASLVLWHLFPNSGTLGETTPAGSALQSLQLEVILSAILMFVILSVSTGAKEKGIMAGVAVGAVIALEALVGGPVSGASMNPARSLAPALVAGRLDQVWIYVVAPIVGALAAVVGCRCVHEQCCCRAVGEKCS